MQCFPVILMGANHSWKSRSLLKSSIKKFELRLVLGTEEACMLLYSILYTHFYFQIWLLGWLNWYGKTYVDLRKASMHECNG
jgi:hypothetical protein